jgi:peptide/nickel transport system permease protein
MFVVSIIVFTLVRLVPGDVVDAMVTAQTRGGITTGIDREAIRQRLGLDVSLPIQYGRWIGVLPGADGNISGILQGDFGNSLWRETPVIDDIIQRWPVTFQLGLLAFLFAQLSLPAGIFSALRQGSWGDYVVRVISILAIAVPGFWLATMVIVFPSIWWGYMPPLILVGFAEDPIANIQMFLIPALVLGLGMSGDTMRMSRTMMLEVLRQDYVRTAWAKGLKERAVVLRHVLKNALIPVVEMIAYKVPIMIGGAVITEQIFNLPGMGRLYINAISTRDYPVVSGLLLIFGFTLVLINVIVDLLYGVLDPRIQYK